MNSLYTLDIRTLSKQLISKISMSIKGVVVWAVLYTTPKQYFQKISAFENKKHFILLDKLTLLTPPSSWTNAIDKTFSRRNQQNNTFLISCFQGAFQFTFTRFAETLVYCFIVGSKCFVCHPAKLMRHYQFLCSICLNVGFIFFAIAL